MVRYNGIWWDMVGHGGTWWDNLSEASPKAAKVELKSSKDVPKAPKGHPKGNQKAIKRQPKGSPDPSHEI